MATAKRSTTSRAKDVTAEPAASTGVEDTGGVEADLLKFVDPEAAKAAELIEKESADETRAGAPTEPEASTEAEAPEAGEGAAGAEPEPEAEEDEGAASDTVGPAGRDYLVLATALVGADGALRSQGQVIELTDDKAEWLLARGMVKPA